MIDLNLLETEEIKKVLIKNLEDPSKSLKELVNLMNSIDAIDTYDLLEVMSEIQTAERHHDNAVVGCRQIIARIE